MKRDWDVIRQVLTDIEAIAPSAKDKFSIGVSRDEKDEEKQIFVAHVFLLRDAGFIKGSNSSTMAGKSILAPDLTWEGHELLATIRSRPVWEKIKSTAQEKGIELSFDAVVQLGKAAVAWVVAQAG